MALELPFHICCGQMATWINMPLGMEAGLGPGDFVLVSRFLTAHQHIIGHSVPCFVLDYRLQK